MFDRNVLLSVSIPAVLAVGVANGSTHIDCNQNSLMQEYIAQHSLQTFGDLIDNVQLYENRDAFFGFAFIVAHPEQNALFNSDVISECLALAVKDFTGAQLLKFVFPSGLPYPYNEIESDPAMSSIFSQNEVIAAMVREF